jgi:hypothetical protein
MTDIQTVDTSLGAHRIGLLAAAVGGITAAAAYAGSVVLGGLIVPGYSHLANSVSELTSPGAPHRALLGAGFVIYNVAVTAIGAGVLLSSARRALTIVAGVLLIACGVAGVLMIEPFPQDPMGTPVTGAGTVHIALAAISAATLVAAAVLLFFGWRADPVWSRLRLPSLVAAGLILLTGGVGAAMISTSVFGLFERFTQLSFLAWFAAIGITAITGLRRR